MEGKCKSRKEASYYEHCRQDIISAIPGRGHRVLDVGCGRGTTLAELKRIGVASETVGVEAEREAAAAAGKAVDRVIMGDIENLELEYPGGYFDVIIMADVLEHLVDPWGALRKMKRYLSRGGLLVASIPNIREFSAICGLVLRGDFRYRDAGIMDRSHLRFFCRKNMVEMIGEVFTISEVRSIPELARGEMALFNRLTLRIFEEFLVLQYIIVARNETNGTR